MLLQFHKFMPSLLGHAMAVAISWDPHGHFIPSG